MMDRERMVADCVDYWTSNGVPPIAAAEMGRELDAHLAAAAADGRSAATVIGDDVQGFAESWAAERRLPAGVVPAPDVPVDVAPQRMRNAVIMASVGGAALLVALGLIPVDGASEDNESWRWVWTVGAVVLAFAEMVTAGFFLLPFAVGMAAASVLAWLDVNLLSQWFAFFGATALAFAVVQRFLKEQDLVPQARIGANRWVDEVAVVLEPIDRHANVGMVRLGSENWRATTPGPPIGEGVTVRVVGVDGTRLVVEPQLEGDGA